MVFIRVACICLLASLLPTVVYSESSAGVLGKLTRDAQRADLACSAREHIVGLKVQYREQIESVQVLCAQRETLSRTRPGPMLAGSRAGNRVTRAGMRTKSVVCPGRVLAGLDGRVGQHVNRLESMACLKPGTTEVSGRAIRVGNRTGRTSRIRCSGADYISKIRVAAKDSITYIEPFCAGSNAKSDLPRAKSSAKVAQQKSQKTNPTTSPAGQRHQAPRVAQMPARQSADRVRMLAPVQVLTREQLMARRQALSQQARQNQTALSKVASKSELATIRAAEREARSLAQLKPGRSRDLAINRFQKKYQATSDSLINKSGLTIANSIRGLDRVIQGYRRASGSRALQLDLTPRTVSPQASSNSRNTQTFSDFPSEFKEQSCRNAVVRELNPFVASENDFFVTQTSQVAAGCHSDTGIGRSINVPPGVDKVRIRLELAGDYRLTAFAAGLGYAQAWADVGVHVRGRFSRPNEHKYFVNDSVAVFVVGGYSEQVHEYNDGLILEAEFRPHASGGTYQIHAYTGMFTVAALSTWSITEFLAEDVRKLTVNYE